MGLFSKKEKKTDAPKSKKQERQDAAPAVVHRSDKLSNVLSVTVASSSLTLIKRNEPFSYAGKNCAIAAMLYTADIGGLSGRAAKNDQDKGQFLQQVTNNHIHIHVDEDMLEEEKVLIIPDQETMDSLEEYAFLSDESLFSGFIPTIVSWDNMGEMEFTEYPDMPKPFSWFFGIQEGDPQCFEEAEQLFGEFLGEPVSDQNSSGSIAGAFAPGAAPEPYEEEGYGEPAAEADEPAGIGISEEESAGNGEVPDFVEYDGNEQAADVPQSDPVTGGNAMSCPKCGTVCVNGECPNCGWSVLSEEEESDSEESLEMNMVIEAASHVFYKDDLQLEASANMFDTLAANNPFVPLEENRGEGYVREYASQLAKNCNTELRALHQKHIYEAREQFLQMIVLAIKDISWEVSIRNENEYSAILADIETRYEAEEKLCDEKIEKRRAELMSRWDAEKQANIDAAVKKAERDYEERFSRAHDATLQDVQSDVLSDLQAKKDSEIKDLNGMRREAAHEKLQAAYQNAFVKVSQYYQEKLDEEANIRKDYDKELTDFVNQRLEDERLHSESLIRNAKYQNELKAKDADISRRLTEMQANHDEQHQRWLTERTDMEAKLAQIRSDYEEKLRAMEDQSAKDKEDIRGLITECATTREKVTADVSKEFELKLSQMSEENRRLEGQIQMIYENNRKLGRTSTAMWIAVAAVATLIGLILGGRVLPQQNNQKYTLQLETQAPAESGEALPENGE